MSDNVVTLPGVKLVASNNEPVPGVVEYCKVLLTAAESGQLRAVAAACVMGGAENTAEVLFHAPYADLYPLAAAIAMLDFKFKQHVWGSS
jgi:hypothetical protein